MLRMLASRLAQAVLVMLVVTACAFLMFRYVGDPVRILSREDATQDEKAELARRSRPRPAGLRPIRPLRRPDVIRGDLGISFRNQRPVADLARRAAAGDARACLCCDRYWRCHRHSARRGLCAEAGRALRPCRAGGLADRRFNANVRDRNRAHSDICRAAWLASVLRARATRLMCAAGRPAF